MNVSLKNRMGTESHGGDGGPLEDREDGEDDAVRTLLLLEPGWRAASAPAAGGGRAARGEQRLHQTDGRRRRRRLSNVYSQTLRRI